MLLVALTTSITQAQPPHGKKPMPDKERKGMHKPPFGEKLNLSDEQKEKAKEIGKDFHEKMKTLKNNDNLTLGEYKRQVAALEKGRKTKMDALLTTEQKNKLIEFRKRAEENRHVKEAARLERMKIKLNLTDAQSSKIKIMQQDLNAKIKSIRENENYTMQERKDKTHEAIIEHKEAVKNILSKEQQDKLENLKKERKPRKQ